MQGFLISVVLTLLAAVPLPAQAYLDPSTGSMVISAIVGLFASVALAAKAYWYRVKRFFRRRDHNGEAARDETGR